MKKRYFILPFLVVLTLFVLANLQGKQYILAAERISEPVSSSDYYLKAYQFIPWDHTLLDQALKTVGDRPMRVIALAEPFSHYDSLSPDSLILLAESYLRMSEDDKAKEIYTMLQGEKETSHSASLALAKLAIDQGETEQAKSALLFGLSNAPNDPDLLFTFGVLLAAMDDPSAKTAFSADQIGMSTEQISALSRLIDIASTASGASKNLAIGVECLKMNQWALAEIAFNRAAEEEPNNPHALAWLGFVKAKNQRPNHLPPILEAEKYLIEDPDLLTILGHYYETTGQFNQAEKYYQQAAALDPANAYLSISLGKMLETSDINAALEQYVNAANLAPSDPEVWKALILFCITTNTYIEDYGFSALSKLSILTPNDPQIYYFLGRIQMAQGNYEQAEISFEQAALANIGRPSLEEILFYQGFLYLKTGKEAQSREKLIQLLEKYPDGRYYQQTLDMLQPNVPGLSSKVNLALPKFLANHSFPAFFHANLSLASTLERVYSPGMVLIQDNFNSSTSIVSTGLAEAGGSEIADGIFKMTITKPYGLMIKSLGQDRLEAEIEVSSYPSDTINETFSGVVCHMRDAKNYTYLSISSLGKANIGQVVNGKQNLLAIKDNTDGSINLGSMINTIKGVCTAEIAQLSINGQVYLTAELSNAFSGDVGFFAGTTTVAPVVILFDDLTVRIPEPPR